MKTETATRKISDYYKIEKNFSEFQTFDNFIISCLMEVVLLARIYPPIVLTLGFFGNTMGIITFKHKNLEQIGPLISYRLLFLMDSLFLICFFISFLEFGFNFQITLYSNITCKAYWYFAYFLSSISPMLLAYITFEKFIVIKFPFKKQSLRSTKYQLIFFASIFTINLLLNLPVAFFYEITEFDNHTSCLLPDLQKKHIANSINAIGKLVVPELCMMISSILLVNHVYKSRNTTNRSFKKDRRVVFSLIALNVSFILLCVPFMFAYYLNSSEFAILFGFYVFCTNYSINFYKLLLTNLVFRKEFFRILFSK